jgi:esterase/lipase
MHLKRWWIFVPLLLAAAYLLGPNPDTPHFSTELPAVPSEPEGLQQYLENREAAHKLKANNQARIIWADDSAKKATEYSILYLHGFSASQAEGEPLHRNIAKQFGCNLYLARLAEHGIDTTEPLLRMTAEGLWQSAKESYAIASKLGKKVIVMGTSTGATLALMLAANYPEIHAQVLLSPNIRIFDKNAWLLNNPWGLQVARAVTGSNYIYSSDTRPLYKQYWSYGYRIESLTELQELLEEQPRPVFKG